MDPIEEGKKYCLKHGTCYQNPYQHGTDAHNQFERGWSQTIKMYPETVARIDNIRKEKEGYKHQARKDKTLAEIYSYKKATGR